MDTWHKLPVVPSTLFRDIKQSTGTKQHGRGRTKNNRTHFAIVQYGERHHEKRGETPDSAADSTPTQLAATLHKLHNPIFSALPPHAVETVTPSQRGVPPDLLRRCRVPQTCASGRGPVGHLLRVIAGPG